MSLTRWKVSTAIIITLLIFISFSLSGIITVRASSKEKYWICFTDKGIEDSNLSEELDKLRSKWPEKSLTRRMKQGISISASDLPVPEEYIRHIENNNIEITQKSRWLNAVSVMLTKSQRQTVSSFNFVKSINRVTSSQLNDYGRDSEETISSTEIQQINEGQKYIYNDLLSRNVNAPQIPPQVQIPLSAYGPSFLQAQQSGALYAHRRGLTGEDVFLGALDTGFELSHIAFTGMDLVAQHDFINNDSDPGWDPLLDPVGQANHGTACLSVITGYDPGNLVGIAPRVSVAVGKTEITGSETRIEEDYWVAGIEWLEWLGVDVVTSSLSYNNWYRKSDFDGVTPFISRAAQRAVELGVVICNSAGNSGPQSLTIGAPCDAPGVLAIAAVDSMGSIVGFSSRGPSADGRIKPDVAALGRGVSCVQPRSFNKYTRWNGTSLSCPIVAGVVALVIEAHPDWSARKVIEAVKMSADKSFSPDYDYGFGIVNAIQAIDYPSISGRITFISNMGEYQTFRLVLKGDNYQSDTIPDGAGYYKFANLIDGTYNLRVYSSDKLVKELPKLNPPPSLPLDIVF